VSYGDTFNKNPSYYIRLYCSSVKTITANYSILIGLLDLNVKLQLFTLHYETLVMLSNTFKDQNELKKCGQIELTHLNQGGR
jgi:hypothetical protein